MRIGASLFFCARPNSRARSKFENSAHACIYRHETLASQASPRANWRFVVFQIQLGWLTRSSLKTNTAPNTHHPAVPPFCREQTETCLFPTDLSRLKHWESLLLDRCHFPCVKRENQERQLTPVDQFRPTYRSSQPGATRSTAVFPSHQTRRNFW